MTHKELEKQLDAANEEMEELADMQMAVLGQTGVHVGAKAVQEYRLKFERDRKRIQERINELKSQLTTT